VQASSEREVGRFGNCECDRAGHRIQLKSPTFPDINRCELLLRVFVSVSLARGPVRTDVSCGSTTVKSFRRKITLPCTFHYTNIHFFITKNTFLS
jgi:hypothetical protein